MIDTSLDSVHLLHECTPEEVAIIRRAVGREKIVQNEIVRRIPPDGHEEAKRELQALERLHSMLFDCRGVRISLPKE